MWHLEIRHYIYDNWSLTSLTVSMSTWHDMNVGERSLFNSPNLLNYIKKNEVCYKVNFYMNILRIRNKRYG